MTLGILNNNSNGTAPVPGRTAANSAFTLIELLVVITIIAVLAALLMPALGTAKDRARTAQCATDEKQVGVGFANYLNDHSGYYPYQTSECAFSTNGAADGTILAPCGQVYRPAYNGSAACVLNWQIAIASYLNGTRVNNSYPVAFQKLMVCPANPWPVPLMPNADVATGGNQFSYTLNNQLIPISWRCGGASSCGASPCSPAGWAKRTNQNDIQHTANAALMLENPLCPGSFARKAAGGYLSDNPWTRLNGLGSWLADSPGVPPPFAGGPSYGMNSSFVTNYCGVADARHTYEWLRPDCNYLVSTFHNLGMNVLFFDGHVARVPKATLLSYTVDVEKGACGGGSNGAHPTILPGGVFWTDGNGVATVDTNDNEYHLFGTDQFPGYEIQ